jgi:hypothetical protein
MVFRIRTKQEIDEEAEQFVYVPPAKFKPGDKVYLKDPAVRWGMPLDFIRSTELIIVEESFSTSESRHIGYTATVEYEGHTYQIYEDSLTIDEPEPIVLDED